MVDNHFYIMSSSANNKTMLHLMAKQTGELKIKLFGGFDEVRIRNLLYIVNVLCIYVIFI
ncbi:hypothetical protein RhiirC2_758596 [Rhizophagus irregularis]|nr:hypothetical protein RhiirC2_758596 [Rhizophagus irregularis]